MRFCIVVLCFILSSCEVYKRNVISQKLMKDYGIVSAVNYEYGFYSVYWECDDPRWRNQPCFGISDHPLKIGIVVGDTIRMETK